MNSKAIKFDEVFGYVFYLMIIDVIFAAFILNNYYYDNYVQIVYALVLTLMSGAFVYNILNLFNIKLKYSYIFIFIGLFGFWYLNLFLLPRIEFHIYLIAYFFIIFVFSFAWLIYRLVKKRNSFSSPYPFIFIFLIGTMSLGLAMGDMDYYVKKDLPKFPESSQISNLIKEEIDNYYSLNNDKLKQIVYFNFDDGVLQVGTTSLNNEYFLMSNFSFENCDNTNEMFNYILSKGLPSVQCETFEKDIENEGLGGVISELPYIKMTMIQSFNYVDLSNENYCAGIAKIITRDKKVEYISFLKKYQSRNAMRLNIFDQKSLEVVNNLLNNQIV